MCSREATACAVRAGDAASEIAAGAKGACPAQQTLVQGAANNRHLLPIDTNCP
ncbi:hypothetical protein Z949_650 [Sulfitobacter guttiformis KCTC 32187]|nr:hypothetical protein Z949_650 [Sulfitobacter guttiformis KCTC 32187]